MPLDFLDNESNKLIEFLAIIIISLFLYANIYIFAYMPLDFS